MSEFFGEGYPARALTMNVMARAFSREALRDILDQYVAARRTSGAGRYAPTKAHILLCVKWLRREITAKNAAKEMGVTTGTVHARCAQIVRMALFDELENADAKLIKDVLRMSEKTKQKAKSK